MTAGLENNIRVDHVQSWDTTSFGIAQVQKGLKIIMNHAPVTKSHRWQNASEAEWHQGGAIHHFQSQRC